MATEGYKSKQYNQPTKRFVQTMELGYGTYVAPNRLLISASYKKDYGKNFGSEVGLIYKSEYLRYGKRGHGNGRTAAG